MTRGPLQSASPETRRSVRGRIPLVPGATVVVVGGGPTGAFFAIELLRRAAELE
jgi:NADH dehydrogenase FAD-containing subunit